MEIFLLFCAIFSIISPVINMVLGMADEILTIREIAELLKINEKTVYKLVAEAKIPGFKVGGSWRFERKEVAAWMKRQVEEQRRGKNSDK